jgi:hypothetical protein
MACRSLLQGTRYVFNFAPTIHLLILSGFWCNHNIAGELSGLSMVLFTRGLGWSAEEVEVFLASVRSDMKDRRIHAWWPM